MRLRTGIRLLAIAVAGLLLAGCTGLPTSGPPNAGLTVGEDGEEPDFTPIAPDPEPGAGPERIVAGFLEASMTPANNWEIARKFLTEDFSREWDPEVGVAIDSSVLKREFDPSVEADDEAATTAEVNVQLDQIASVDADGAYSAATGQAKATYRLVRAEGGEWRISEAKDGITLDIETFAKVYEKFSLKYFDPSWSHLVPDVRWYPRRAAMATTITRAVISGTPTDWLAPAVQTAFPADVALVGDAVPIDADQVASVSLTRSALSASSAVLARMRTQLEASLAGAGVAEVRFVVDGSPLSADTVSLDESIVDPGVLVLTDETFGTAGAGGDIAPVTGLTAQIDKISSPIQAMDISRDALLAAVQQGDGRVFAVSDGTANEVDSRSNLVTPSLDPFGFIWTVPRHEPGEVKAWEARVVEHNVVADWPETDSISHLRVSADGARVAGVVASGGQHRLVVASVVRGEGSAPVELGDVQEIALLSGPADGIAWIGADSIAVLSSAPGTALTTYMVGGPAAVSPAPEGATSLAGAKTTTGLRVLTSDGAVYALRGSSWQSSVQDVLVLGTRAGY
ncbi:LpqB family beta-propeller domain-containing protein [Microbacterium alcoholitolerans]|uniref:LpqB family beta-propeller domain-containing protein n=1 Tax=unclassified Microbacterium TaxID=2609290 RepID=UPI003D16FA5A